MYTLFSTNTLKFNLGAAITTNQLSFSATYADITVADNVWNGLTTVKGNSNSTTLVDLVAAPAATNRLDIKTLSLHNLDTVDQTINIEFDATTVIKLILKAGYTFLYNDGIARVLNNYGVEDSYVQSTSFSKAFDATTDWGTAAGGYYTLTVLESEHQMGIAPSSVQLFDTTTGNSVDVDADSLSINGTGDIDIVVVEIPDGRFTGKINIIK